MLSSLDLFGITEGFSPQRVAPALRRVRRGEEDDRTSLPASGSAGGDQRRNDRKVFPSGFWILAPEFFLEAPEYLF